MFDNGCKVYSSEGWGGLRGLALGRRKVGTPVRWSNCVVPDWAWKEPRGLEIPPTAPLMPGCPGGPHMNSTYIYQPLLGAKIRRWPCLLHLVLWGEKNECVFSHVELNLVLRSLDPIRRAPETKF